MYALVFVLASVLISASAQRLNINPNEPIPIVKQTNDVSPDGSYQWSYETANGISANEQGALKGPESLSVNGGYQYTDNAGNVFQIQYLADENGFQPQGAHLPVAPPIPEAILRALEYNAAHPEEDNDGQPGQGQGVVANRRPFNGRK